MDTLDAWITKFFSENAFQRTTNTGMRVGTAIVSYEAVKHLETKTCGAFLFGKINVSKREYNAARSILSEN